MPSIYNMTDAEYAQHLMGRSVGGSQVGALLGVDDYKSAADVYDQVLGLVPRGTDNHHMARGRILEPHIADHYTSLTGRQLYQIPTQFDPVRPWVRASTDRLMRANTSRRSGGVGILEIKCLAIPNYRRTRNDGIEPCYYAQLMHYLDVLNKNWGAFAVFNADDWAMYHFDVERDDEYIYRLRDAIDIFWHDNILQRVRPPDPSSIVDDPSLRPRIGAEAVRRNDLAWERAVTDLRAATEQKNIAEHSVKLAQDRLKEMMGDNGLVIGGGARISYKEATRRNFNPEALQTAHPEIDITPFYRVTATRTFRVTFD